MLPPVPILKGDKGEPCWPDGVVGSLTHCTGYRGAVVGRSAAVRSVGIDAEPHDVLPDGVLDAISLAAERREMAQRAGRLHWDRILFCAKEATYKAWFPLTKRWLGFRGRSYHVRRRQFRYDGYSNRAILIDRPRCRVRR